MTGRVLALMATILALATIGAITLTYRPRSRLWWTATLTATALSLWSVQATSRHADNLRRDRIDACTDAGGTPDVARGTKVYCHDLPD